MRNFNFSQKKKYVIRRRIALVLIFLALIILTNQAFSFVSAKMLEWSDSVQVSRVENTLEKINNGDLKIKSYVINEGERLWDIAESLQQTSNVKDVRDVVSIIKDVNDAMGVKTDVLQEGQTIYIPVDLNEAL